MRDNNHRTSNLLIIIVFCVVEQVKGLVCAWHGLIMIPFLLEVMYRMAIDILNSESLVVVHVTYIYMANFANQYIDSARIFFGGKLSW